MTVSSTTFTTNLVTSATSKGGVFYVTGLGKLTLTGVTSTDMSA